MIPQLLADRPLTTEEIAARIGEPVGPLLGELARTGRSLGISGTSAGASVTWRVDDRPWRLNLPALDSGNLTV